MTDKPKTQYLRVDTLTLLESNPRKINKNELESLKKSIETNERFFWARPLLVNKRDGKLVVYAGNQRLKAAQELKMGHVPCIVESLTKSEEKERVIRDNVSNGSWDDDGLKKEWNLEDLKSWGVPKENLWKEAVPGAEEDEFVEVGAYERAKSKTKVQLGDVFVLGSHRLMCGDSTSAKSVQRLMNGNKADMLLTDPPYGINYAGKGITAGVKGNDFGKIKGDDSTDVAKKAIELCKDISIQIWWGANHYAHSLPESRGWIYWDKIIVGDFYSSGELAWTTHTGHLRQFTHKWHGMIKDSEQGQARMHPTQKPIELMKWCIDNYGKESVNIIDLFGGSGSTLIACEQLNRKCFMMEIDPVYVQIIIDRFIKFKGSHEEVWKIQADGKKKEYLGIKV